MRAFFLASAIAMVAAPASAAGHVVVTLHGGRVSVVAIEATSVEILDAWARAGQTTIINSDRLPATPLTISLADVPEERALDTILRAAGGYVAVQRAPGATGLSQFERIVILPGTVGDRNAAVSIRAPQQTPAPPPEPEPEPSLVTVNGVTWLIGPTGLPDRNDQADAAPAEAAPASAASATLVVSGTTVLLLGDEPPPSPSSRTIAPQPVQPSAKPALVGTPTPGMTVQPPPPSTTVILGN